jgi:2-methylcitrate dehydratase
MDQGGERVRHRHPVSARAAVRSAEYDPLLQDIADYVLGYRIRSRGAWEMARRCVLDTLGCAFMSLAYPECMKVVGPVSPGTVVPHGARVPGTSHILDPIEAAFSFGSMLRWLDFNDSFAAGAGHPSDNLAGILCMADHLSRRNIASGKPPLAMREVLTWLIKAYEIHGIIALRNNFGEAGLDHGWFERVATAATVTHMLGGGRSEILGAVSNAVMEVNIRTFRQAPNTGSRKSWAAGDSAARGVWFALLAMTGEMGYPGALTSKQWGFYDVAWNGRPFEIPRTFGCHVMENVMFKISFPAGAHAQSAIESGIRLHKAVRDRLQHVEHIEIRTHQKAKRVMDKKGVLTNPADRDHCMQYVVAVALIYGKLDADDYSDAVARDARIDRLREKMIVEEDPGYTSLFFDLDRRANPSSVRVCFSDGTFTEIAETLYPIGHPSRRRDALPLLEAKFRASLPGAFPENKRDRLLALSDAPEGLDEMPVNELMDLVAIP